MQQGSSTSLKYSRVSPFPLVCGKETKAFFLAYIVFLALLGSAPAEGSCSLHISKHSLYSGTELGGCMVAISCIASLFSSSVMPSLGFGANLSTHQIQLSGGLSLQQQSWGCCTVWDAAGSVPDAMLLLAGTTWSQWCLGLQTKKKPNPRQQVKISSSVVFFPLLVCDLVIFSLWGGLFLWLLKVGSVQQLNM